VDSLLVVVHEIRDGRIVRLRAFTDEDGAMGAAEERAESQAARRA
jgi:ketosteroid isomerase-like protein